MNTPAKVKVGRVLTFNLTKSEFPDITPVKMKMKKSAMLPPPPRVWGAKPAAVLFGSKKTDSKKMKNSKKTIISKNVAPTPQPIVIVERSKEWSGIVKKGLVTKQKQTNVVKKQSTDNVKKSASAEIETHI